jgi:indolepyruvate ferredoxin oxidoreductase alpha subunit
MCSGIGAANGLGQLERFGLRRKVVTVAGDSTFFHACLPGLVNAKHKNANVTFLILDNSTTAMTGFQSHPGSSRQSPGDSPVSIEKLVRAVEPAHFEVLDATDIEAMINAIHDAVRMSGLKVLLIKSICRLEEQGLGETYEEVSGVFVDLESCKGESCRICTSQFACLALGWNEEDGKAEINDDLCVRCGACIPVCPHDAIRREGS